MKNVFFVFTISSLVCLTILTGCGTNSAVLSQEQNDTENTSPEQARASSELIMATSADYPPYEFHDTTGGKDEIVGFDIDVANFIAKEVGVTFKIKEVEFNQLIPTLLAKRADFVMAGMTPTPDRLKEAAFSDMYYEAKNTIVANKGSNLINPEDLVGRKVGVQKDTIQESQVKKIKDIQVRSLNDVSEILQGIKDKQIDAAIIEDTIAKSYAQSMQDIEYHTIQNAVPSGSAVAFPPGSTYPAEFNKAIKKLKDSGELDHLIKKWFEKK